MENLLDNLNKQQREAVEHTEGPLLILAGAGSGKTRVLTCRIAYLINEKNVYPSNILAITFTNKAAKEMKERVQSLLEGSYDMWVSTFHAACARILRTQVEKLNGYKKNFIIFDTDDQVKVIKECLKELNYNEKNFPPKEMLSSISKAKDQLMTPGRFMDRYGRDFRLKKVADIYSLYQKKLMANNALDFDDILFKTVELFQNNPDVLQYYQNKFRYIMVDEYQDTNYCQYMLVNLLAKSHRNLCVVGDDDQCIYSWRGADIGNILNFEKDFPDTKVIKLEQNYRSTQTILDAANSVIDKNFGRKSKRLWTENGEGKPIVYYKAMDERDEGDFIIGEIDRLAFQEHRDLKNFAILYRTNSQSRVIEEMCMARGIPYKIVGGHRFYDRMEVKDVIAYLRAVQDPDGDLSIKRIINVPKRGIGKATLDLLEAYARDTGSSLYEALLFADSIDGIGKKAKNSIKDFVRLIAELMDVAEKESASAVIDEVIMRSGYLEVLEKGDDEDQERGKNIKELISAALEYEEKNEDSSLQGFLENMALMSDIDGLKEEREGITMMTLHSAKGLEFPVVFICGLEEGLFPTQRAFFDEHQLEEERRLMYVGVTRAREKLYFSSAFERTIYGSRSYTMESRFLREIPKDLMITM
ncbi:DNA helicase PcrA [Lutispora sp.]|uniref:DNA helicase PcrA n=1 Tax=Lutispora sp. TaxID=2828727 RepID=UPI002B2085DA|nr:DNA helicase PcrA [Lutispora sp.]MEA4961953.1 DNA helicase PcrA [Lutispora sp.]